MTRSGTSTVMDLMAAYDWIADAGELEAPAAAGVDPTTVMTACSTGPIGWTYQVGC